MILCEFTPTGGDMIRCAMADFCDIHLWKSFITSFSSLKISMPSVRGGYATPTFSDISFSPDMGRYDTATVKLRWVESGDETGGVVIFDGTARLSEPGYRSVRYTLKRQENAAKVPESTSFVETLANVMTTLCGPTYLNKTLDITRARIPSPVVSHTITTEQLAKDFASNLCQSLCHGLIEIGNTLYLIDMYDLLTGKQAIDPWTTKESKTQAKKTYSSVKFGDYIVNSTTVLNGDELSISTIYHITEADILGFLGTILEMENRPVVEISAWITEDSPVIGGVYSFLDSLHFNPIQFDFVASDIVYNFDSQTMQISGAGTAV